MKKKEWIDVPEGPRHRIPLPEPCITFKKFKKICQKLKRKNKDYSVLTDYIDILMTEVKKKSI